MCEVGDKFIIEAEEMYKTNTFKGFNSLFFDENKLDRFKKYYENAGYEKGLNDAWDYITKIYGLQFHDIEEIYGKDNDTLLLVLGNFAPKEAIGKLKAWEEKQEIKVGDVVVVYPNNYKACVISVADTGQLTVYDKQRNAFKVHKDNVRKTSKHIDLTEIFNGLEEENV